MQGLGLPWIGEPAFVAHEATGAVASPQNSWPSIGGPIWESRGGILGQVGGALNTPESGTGVCEIKTALANLTISLQPPPPLFQCWRACLCEGKVVRNKSRVLREDGAEEGNIEIGGTGFPRKPERANLRERLLIRKHRSQILSHLS